MDVNDDYGRPAGEWQWDTDDSLLALNAAIRWALTRYLPDEFFGPGRIRFDMIGKDKLPSEPTVSVFLYDIQEDLELRHGQSRHYNPTSHMLSPGQVHVRCCYLLTYWEPADSATEGFDTPSQQMQVINAALNAILNMQLPELPSAFVRVIAPSEHLSSLGSFWQSMGDRPRLSLNFTVTIPIALGGKVTDPDTIKPVLSVDTTLTAQDASWEQEDRALQFKRALIAEVLSAYQKSSPKKTDWVAVRAQLARLQVSYSYGDVKPQMQVAGDVDSEVYVCITAVIEALKSNKKNKPEAGNVDMSELRIVSVS